MTPQPKRGTRKTPWPMTWYREYANSPRPPRRISLTVVCDDNHDAAVNDRFNAGIEASKRGAGRLYFTRGKSHVTLIRTTRGRIARFEKTEGDRRFKRCHDYWSWQAAIHDAIRDGWRSKHEQR